MARMTLIGRLGAAPERRQTKNGKDFLIYKVATTDPLPPPREGSGESEASCAAAAAAAAAAAPLGSNADLGIPASPTTHAEEPVEPTTSWHTVFANGPVIDKLQNLEKG